MTDNPEERRHRRATGQPTERLRFLTQPQEGTPRRRRHRVEDGGISAKEITDQMRAIRPDDEAPAPAPQPDTAAADQDSAATPAAPAETPAPVTEESAPAAESPVTDAAAPPVADAAAEIADGPSAAELARRREQEAYAAEQERRAAALAKPPVDARPEVPRDTLQPLAVDPAVNAGNETATAGASAAVTRETPRQAAPEPDSAASTESADSADGDDTADEPAPPRKSRRRTIVFTTLAVVVALVIAGLGYGLYRVFGPADDYDSTTGSSDTLVYIPRNATLTSAGQVLKDASVVASVDAFTDAAKNGTVKPGYYKLRTKVSGATAVQEIANDDNRMGLANIAPGLQLDTKTGADKTVTKGIFERIAEATDGELNGQKIGVTAAQLTSAAATASLDDLGIPSWAREAVAKLGNDHRRIEGLIAPQLWDDIDPRGTPVSILRDLITQSAKVLEGWGLLNIADSGMKSPYDMLIEASIVESEVPTPDYYGKVARVIINRLEADQRLEMDSTLNYTAKITNIDVNGENLAQKTKWNTYFEKGLPPTPIAAVGDKVLAATTDPPAGNWLYFLTVNKQGLTKFTNSYEQHQRNRQEACDNGLLTTECN